MEHYFNNQSLPHDAQIYRKKLTVLYAVTETIFYRIRRLRSEMCGLRMGPLPRKGCGSFVDEMLRIDNFL